jgi:hypothetical protein
MNTLKKIKDDLANLVLKSESLSAYPESREAENDNDRVVNEYNELVKNYSKENDDFFDIVFELKSDNEDSSDTFRMITDFLRKKGHNVQKVYDNKSEDCDAHFIVVMPSSSYQEFSSMVYRETNSSTYNVVGERSEYFYFNHLNKDISLSDIKDKIKSDNEKCIPNLFSNDFGIGVVEIEPCSFDPESTIYYGVETYFTQIGAMENTDVKIGDVELSTIDGITMSKDNISPLAEANKRKDKHIDNPKNKTIENFIEDKKENLNKKERKIQHLLSSINATEKRIEKFYGVPEGHSFSCVCGCKGKTVKTNAKAMFKRLSGSGNCKDKHFGNKRQLVKILLEYTDDMKLDMKTRVPNFHNTFSDSLREYKMEISKLKQSKKARRY